MVNNYNILCIQYLFIHNVLFVRATHKVYFLLILNNCFIFNDLKLVIFIKLRRVSLEDYNILLSLEYLSN